MTELESDEDSAEMDKLLAELEKDSLSEDSDVIIEKQIKKAKDENKAKELNWEDPIDEEIERTEENTW